jgi:putative flippase GtrA
MTSAPPIPASGRPSRAEIAGRYVLFAVIATAMNLGAQAIVYALVPVQALALSMLAGTGVGFAVKYLLDKRWIFFDGYHGPAKEARKIFLYGSFSVAMTLIFWGFEIGFLKIWGTNTAKYAGAIIGLAIGNFLKYLLDSNFTFNQNAFNRKAPAPDWSAPAGTDSGEETPVAKARSWN